MERNVNLRFSRLQASPVMPLQGTREPPRLSRLQVSSTAPRQGTTEALRSDELTFLINHIFLPPKLPQAEESSTTKKDRILVKALKAAAEKYRDVEGVHGKERMVIVCNMLSSYLAIKSSGQGAISAAILGEKIRDMKSGDVIALDISAQNAGLVLRHAHNEMIFETFELSPAPAEVTETSGRLRCSYPGPIIAVGIETAMDPAFVENLALFLEEMDIEELEQVVPVIKKAGANMPEFRDTNNPMFITSMLSGILRGLGRPVDSAGLRIQKNIRDDVLYHKARGPWRRSPLWLLLRVALQTTLRNGEEYDLYKAFMLYFMTDILDKALRSVCESETLFVMNAKLARRILKAGDGLPEFVKKRVEGVVGQVREHLEKEWVQIQGNNSNPNQWNPDQLSFEKDTALSLHTSRSYLNEVLGRNNRIQSKTKFKPSGDIRISCNVNELPSLKKGGRTGFELFLLLGDFESWVEHNLDGWQSANIRREAACQDIGNIIKQYTDIAKDLYDNSPENLSIMLLTTMELWVVLDKTALHHCKLMEKYSPEIPESLLDPLLLRKRKEMVRLNEIETYIRTRQDRADKHSYPRILSEDSGTNTFAVRFFEGSPDHRQLTSRIEAQAQIERSQKEDEYHRKTREYDDLMRRRNEMSCEYYWKVNWRGRGHNAHAPGCARCALERQAGGMHINVHEWPLPSSELKKKIAVFELQRPAGFSVWRDITYLILVDVCTPAKFVSETAPGGNIAKYSSLRSHYSSASRVTLSSKKKCFLNAHYSQRSFPTQLETICVNNGLGYQLYDQDKGGWVEENLRKWDVRPMCTFQLPPGPYQNMQYTLDNTVHTSNSVIASQARCSTKLSLHEFEAFGELRSGHLLQWMNIARELRSRNLTWVNEEVGILLMQTVWQAGPNNSGVWCRESHLDPVDSAFGNALLDEIEEVWTRIRDNWREITSAHSLIILSTRILSFSTAENIKDRAAALLRKARIITLAWTRQLIDKLDNSEKQDDKTAQNLRLRLVQVAATCRTTYDVDYADLWRVLGPDDLETAIECAFILHDNAPVNLNDLSPLMRALLERNRRLSWNLEPKLRGMILQTQPCRAMNNCIEQAWSAYVPGGCWEALKMHYDRWVVTKTSPDANAKTYDVQCNLLIGQLLIDGTPLKRLPPDYIAHPTYLRTFGDKVFDVCPGSAGMRYQSKKKYHGFQLSFSMESTELLIRTTTKDDRTLELIPHSKFHGDFPKHFVENYAHWMDIHSGEIEFRPLGSQWDECCRNLRVFCRELVMERDGRRFLDVRSASAKMIYSILGVLEYSDYVEITITNLGDVEVNLPRFQMVFFLNEDKKLECRQFRDMIVDENQSFGTLTGLRTRLVLRYKGRGKDSHCRKVLIPYGKVAYGTVGSHVEVTICTKEDKTVVYHHFDIDTTLWRLSGSGGLSSRLYKIYLHALTSHCLPDSLSGRTGTEEALYDLNSAAVWSFKELEGVDLDLLNHIAGLTPARMPYPKHLRKMQTVSWNDLPPLSQHEGFYQTVQRILEYNSRFEFFQDDELPASKVEIRETEPYLVNKAAMRNRAFQAEDFGNSNVALGEDRTYISRDVPSRNTVSLESKVCAVARNTNNWSTSLDTAPGLLERFEGWSNLAGNGTTIALGYDSSWLKANLRGVWCSLYDTCRMTTKDDRYSLMFLLAPMIYRSESPIDMQLVWTLLAFATIPKFESIRVPDYDSYDLGRGYHPGSDILSTVQKFTVSFERSKEWSEPQRMHESLESWYDRREQLYDDHLKSQTDGLVKWFQSEWICDIPALYATNNYPLFKVKEMQDAINSLFHNCYKNLQFKNHIEEVQQILDLARSNEGDFPTYMFSPCEAARARAPYISIAELSITPTERMSQARSIIIRRSRPTPDGRNTHLDDGRLKSLLLRLKEKSNSDFKKSYMEDLLESLSVFQKQAESTPNWGMIHDQQVELLERFRLRCRSRLDSMFNAIREKLELPRVSGYTRELLRMAGLWPRITPTSLLGLLAKPTSMELDFEWKQTLVDYAVAMTDFQRATRLHIVALDNNQKELVKEAENPGHKDWDPMEYPDWILLEIENNLLIRPIQAQIASRMIDPPSGRSAVLQLNMGEGKSSVIVPIVSAALADGEKLVRVVVLKPLATQMFRLLVQKLGGLTSRRIFYMPFNRNIGVDSTVATQIRGLYEECMRTRGILLVQPEHLLSFKLMGFEQLEHKSNEVAKKLLDTSRWLEEKARDILDESDEILHVRYQLIYTLGKQTWLDHSPDRWVILQDLFNLVREHATDLRDDTDLPEEYSKGVEISGESPGCFPQTRILEYKAGQKLLDDLENDISLGRLPHLSIRLWPTETRQLASKFIRDPNMSEEKSKRLFCGLQKASSGSDSDWKTLLLLRGMIAHGILLTALRDRRWRVDYGLDEKRFPPTLLAVPYRAKDCPALRAEFSHPDMAITLTCLSYYYGGLKDSQLEVSFAALLKSNNPPAEYQRWVGGDSTIPESIRTLSGVNIDDFDQRSKIVFPKLRNRKSVIDFYLSQVVFPKDAKEFPHKLSTSGWDLAEKRVLPTTGFSGTNDNRFLLPLSLKQDDVPENEGTNAKVLHYLLKEENDHYQCIKSGNDKVSALLEMIVTQNHKIRVILDVGAQILLENKVVATKLLQLGQITDSSPQAVVYFDDRDELIVQKQDGSTELLLYSPFAKQLGKCFVYLDEAHTRGTDLKLPIGSRAAVTLGPKLTKDRLVQACMRMRQLGDGHTVMFFAPTEVDRKICDISSQHSREPKAIDVVEWAIGETCLAITNSVPLWASQGLSYHRRQKEWLEYWKDGSPGYNHSGNLLQTLRERESQTLDELYGCPSNSKDSSSAIGGGSNDENITAIQKKCDYFGIDNLHGVRTQEEQEREVSQETEQERNVERPPQATPTDHLLHHDVIQFVTAGKEPEVSSDAFMSAFSIFDKTSAPNPGLHGWSEQLLVTRDFARTIVEKNKSLLDDYLRPVNWVLSSRDPSICCQVIISPYEANQLLPRIRNSKFVRLHVYAPRVAEDMKTFESMNFISIPPVPCNSMEFMMGGVIELNIFAGQLCLNSYDEYKKVCKFLGLHLGSVENGDEGHIDSEGGFMSWGRRQILGIQDSPFKQNPVSRIKSFIMFRRKGQDYLETHMGKLLRGVPLLEKDFS